MSLKFNKLVEIINTETREVAEDNPKLLFQIAKLIGEFKQRFANKDILNYEEAFSLCEELDAANIRVPTELMQVVMQIRRSVKETILHELFNEEYNEARFDINASKEATRNLEIAKVTSRLIRNLLMIKPEEFDQEWIKYHFEDEYNELCRLLLDEDTKLINWEEFKALLPPDLRRRFVPKYTAIKGNKLDKIDLAPYEEIAKKLGPAAVAELLISSGRIKRSDFKKAASFISESLGTCQTEPTKPEDFNKNGMVPPNSILHKKGVFDSAFIQLRNYTYKELLDGEADVTSDVASINMEKYKRRVKGILNEILDDEDYEEHAKLLKKLLKYFEDVLTMKVPERMRDQLVYNGKSYEFPSLRQRIAMKEMKDRRRQLISFFMGKGKTAAAFLSKEYVGAKRMLYVCPPGELEKEIAERVKKYYKKGEVPTVGIVKSFKPTDEQRKEIREKIKIDLADSGLTKKQLGKEFNERFKAEITILREKSMRAALSQEVVILPYSMFSSKVGGKKITDLILEEDFDFLTVDEVHHARKDDTKRNTRIIYKLATGIKDLYDKGHIALLSADPMPNSPNDIMAQLRIWNKDLYKDVTSLRSAARKDIHPLFIRNAIAEFMLLIDDEEKWEDHEVQVEFELNTQERIIYNSILWDEDLSATEKLHILYLCVLNPGLFSTADNVDSSLFRECVNLTEQSFKDGYNSVVIVENRLKQGVTRKHNSKNGDSIYIKLKAKFGDDVEIELLDGSVKKSIGKAKKKSERDRVTELMKKKSEKKRIFLVNGNIIREGINLSAISRCIMLDPTFNRADTIQLLKRFAREENFEAKLYSLCAMGTIMEAIRNHAQAKFKRTQIVKRGGNITQDDEKMLKNEDFNEDLKLDDEYVLISSHIKDHTLTERQKMAIVMSQLFGNRKVENVEELLDKFGKYIAERYMIEWESSPSGNNSRLVIGLIKDLEEAGIIQGNKFLDVACGPMILRNTLGEVDDSKERIINSLDINSHMLDIGKTTLKSKDKTAKPRVKVGRMNDLSAYPNESFDVVNNSLAFDYTKLSNKITKHFEKDQRIQALMEFNRVLKPGGVAIITLPPNLTPSFAMLEALETHFGFEVLSNFTGQGVSVDKKDIDTFRNNTIVFKKVGKPNIEGIKLKDLELIKADGPSGTRIRDKNEEKAKQMPLRCAHNEFAIKKFGYKYPSDKQPTEAEKTQSISEFPRSPKQKAAEKKAETIVRDRNDNTRSAIRQVLDKYKGDFPLFKQKELEKSLKVEFSYSRDKKPSWFRYTDIKCTPDEVQYYSID